MFTPASWQELTTELAHTRETGIPYELELEMVRPDGSHGWMLARGEVVRDGAGDVVGLRGMALDITERRNYADELRALSTRDPLTGLANRTALMEEIPRALNAGRRSGRGTALLMVDLDRFKVVNDTLGHAAGDSLLVKVAARLDGLVRAGDLTARLGGDEFVVVMRDLLDPAEAANAAERVLTSFRTPFATGGTEFHFSASIGVAIATETSTGNDLLREADTAMYRAKEQGRDQMAVFNEDLRTALTERLAVETALRRALSEGQLCLWYQPEIDLGTGAVVAVEALLRWHHPDGQIWSADHFIDVAEETGLILDMGDWIIHEACRQAASWNIDRPDRPITMRVNVSALQLAENGLLDSIDEALTGSGVDPALVCLEITETALLRDSAAVRANLAGIHDRGLGVALDDFGTGFASLGYLSSFAVDVIKIDRSFLADTTAADHPDRMVAGIIALAKALGIGVTAEGVQHQEQAAHLYELGCPSAQGWLFAPALPPAEIASLLDHIYPPPDPS